MSMTDDIFGRMLFLTAVGFGCLQYTLAAGIKSCLGALVVTETAHVLFHVAVGITLLHHPLSVMSMKEK